ncbi:MAG: TolC family protein, partial [Bacteroidales bacterium]|nr:TolC family protein [Bacteroidales bacterium]
SRRKASLSVLDWIPEINVGAGNDFNWGRSVDMQELLIVDNRMTLTASFTASASLSLTKGLFNILGSRADKLDEKSAGIALQQALIELDAGVTGAFFQVLLCNEACEICSRNCAEIDASLETAALEAETGSRAGAELFDLQAQACRERSALAEARNKLRIARMTLRDYLNLPPEEEFELLPPTEDSILAPPPPLPESYGSADAEPSIALAMNQLERDRLEVSLARAAFLPTLAIAGGCGTYYSNSASGKFGEQLSGNVNPSAGITLSIPILGGASNARTLAGAKAALARQELEVEKVRREALSAIREGIAEAENLYGSLSAAEASLKAARSVEALAQERFRTGEISGTEYLAARNARLRAEAQRLQARYRYLLQLKLLECRHGIVSY